VAGARFTRRFPEKILLTKHDLGHDEGRNLAVVPAPSSCWRCAPAERPDGQPFPEGLKPE